MKIIEVGHQFKGALKHRTSTKRIVIHHAASAGSPARGQGPFRCVSTGLQSQHSKTSRMVQCWDWKNGNLSQEVGVWITIRKLFACGGRWQL